MKLLEERLTVFIIVFIILFIILLKPLAEDTYIIYNSMKDSKEYTAYNSIRAWNCLSVDVFRGEIRSPITPPSG